MSDNVMNLKSVEAEFKALEILNNWPAVFQNFAVESKGYDIKCDEARKPANKPLNRYRDVSPYDHSRVILQGIDVDYINANYVKMERANRRYILTQGPLMNTVEHFWLMVWEQNSRAILMLNKVFEKNEPKCQHYWPRGTGPELKLTFETIGITVEQMREVDSGHFTTRVFSLTKTETEETRKLLHFHYTTWPDFGVPTSPNAFLEYLSKVRESGALESDVGPAIVHCSAGIGRSGTFCLVDSCLYMIENSVPDSVSVKGTLLQMRKDRMGLIQTPDQLRFSYLAIIEGAKRLDPNWKPDSQMSESVYSTVAVDNEEAPPPPPPRGESLSQAPARPLPAIPTSTSLGDMKMPDHQGSSSDESLSPPAQDSSADDEADEPVAGSSASGAEPAESVRRRRARDLGERVATMKKRARDAEKWESLKRSLYKPFTLTVGFILASIVIYSYVKH